MSEEIPLERRARPAKPLVSTIRPPNEAAQQPGAAVVEADVVVPPAVDKAALAEADAAAPAEADVAAPAKVIAAAPIDATAAAPVEMGAATEPEATMETPMHLQNLYLGIPPQEVTSAYVRIPAFLL